jgi:DNA ligase (NAD+)
MLSLTNTYSMKEIETFYKKVSKYIKSEKTDLFVCEKKFDGMSMSLIYDKNGDLERCLTRGDGEFGTNITISAKKYIKNLVLKVPGQMIIRGEAVNIQSNSDNIQKGV